MKALLRHIAALCAILATVAALHAVAPSQSPFEDLDLIPREPIGETSEQSPGDIVPAFRVIGLDDRPAQRDTVRIAAMYARKRLYENTQVDWQGTALIVWAGEDLYQQKTGFSAENTAAAASAEQMTIWINERAWAQADNKSRQETMTHEVGHLLLGSLPGGKRLPLWANEGLVQHLAGQITYDEQMRLLAAHAAGSLPQLRDLQKTFPRQGQTQNLAYAMSYNAIGVVAQSYGDKPGEVRRLVRALADEHRGQNIANEFWDDFRVEGWQLATERSLGNRFATAIIVLTGTTSIFVIILIIAVFAYFKKLRKNAVRSREWEEEDESWAESLTDEDVQDIYGDREDRWQ